MSSFFVPLLLLLVVKTKAAFTLQEKMAQNENFMKESQDGSRKVRGRLHDNDFY